MEHTINVTRSSMPSYEEYCAEIRDLWDSRWLTNSGEKHRRLQAELESYLGVPHVTLYTNGHLALEGALAAFDLPAGGEVITTPFTFASTTQAIVRCGLTPVFCDIDPITCTLDPAKIEPLITDKTCAIVPVHVYGTLCDVDAIGAIARRHGLKVVYDAAHAFGVTRGGVSAASFGDASMFSFHATKVFHTIEGGAVCYADGALTARLDAGKNFGLTGPETITYLAGNAKMNEFQAAMGLCNLRHLAGEIEKRRLAAEHYRQRFSGVPGLTLRPEQPGVASNYAYFPVIFDGFALNRDEVAARLAEHRIYARKYFHPLTSTCAAYAGRFPIQPTPVAEHIARCVLTLPLYADLTVEDADRICDCILSR